MTLTEQQADSLTELVNIAYGRAAAALSQMTSDRVLLSVPNVMLVQPEEIESIMGGSFASRVTCVNQVFTGPIAGKATLLLDERAARVLTELISQLPDTPSDEDIRETTTEVGNILINSCLGVFGNLLRYQVGFTVPNVEIKSAAEMVRSFAVDSRTLDYTIFVHTKWELKNSNVVGYLAMMLGVASFERLLEGIDSWG